ncbi:MAG: DUF6600 domain-containing protein, partial [Verrucomicrobiota bacterium]
PAPAPAPAAGSVELRPELADVVEMAKRGVGDEALLAFIEQNPVIHRIAPETIIFLNDLGVPENVVALMIRQGDAVEEEQEQGGVPMEPAQVTGQPVASRPPPAPLPPKNAPPVVNNHYYGALDPYGDWFYDSSHGWVWRPTVAAVDVGWRPYSQGGRWIYSDVGWYWNSYYSWGWAPFHYGRWHRSTLHGWYWVPGYKWSPAWVMWRSNNHYAGWAPLPPGSHYVHGVGYSWGGAHVGFSFGFGLGHGWFTYCDYAHLRHRRLHRHRVPDNRVAIVHNETTVVNNYITENNTTIVNAGIPPAVIADKTREPVQKMRIRELDLEVESIARVGQIDANGKTMAIYRPEVPTPPDTPGEKPSGRSPVTKNPSLGDSSADKPEADQKLLKQYGNGTSVANRSKITGSLGAGKLTRPLGRSYNLREVNNSRPLNSGGVAASPSRTGATKSNRSASTSAKPDASGSRTLKSTFSAPSKSRTTPLKPSAQTPYSRSSPRANSTPKPGQSATSRLITPSTRSSATPNRAWKQRPSPSYSAPRSTRRSVAPKSTAQPSRLPSARPVVPSYSPPARSYSAPRQSRPTPSRSYRAPAASRPAPSRATRPPARSTPSRSYSAPSRATRPPARSTPSRSNSAPSRSYSPPAPSPPPSSSGGGSSSRSPGSPGGGSKNPR